MKRKGKLKTDLQHLTRIRIKSRTALSSYKQIELDPLVLVETHAKKNPPRVLGCPRGDLRLKPTERKNNSNARRPKTCLIPISDLKKEFAGDIRHPGERKLITEGKRYLERMRAWQGRYRASFFAGCFGSGISLGRASLQKPF